MTKEQIDEISLRVAKAVWNADVVANKELFNFANALLAELARVSEPVAWAYYSEKYTKPLLEMSPNARGYEGEWRKVPLFTNPVQIALCGYCEGTGIDPESFRSPIELLCPACDGRKTPPSTTQEGWTATHLKTGNKYLVTGESIHAGNVPAVPGELMVEYRRDGEKYVRAAGEFQDKFAATPKE